MWLFLFTIIGLLNKRLIFFYTFSIYPFFSSTFWLQNSYRQLFHPSSLYSVHPPLHPPHSPRMSLYPTSVWGAGVDSKLAYCQAYYAGLCGCTVLERTREAKAGPLHHPHQHWLGSGRGSVHAHERLARPGPYAFNTGTDVERRPWALTPLITSFCPPHCLKPVMLSWATLSGQLVKQV